MKLYSYFRSSCAWRVRIALNLKGLQYEIVAVSIRPGVDQQKAPAFGEVNHMRQVPVLEIQESGSSFRLTQSVAICEYLDELYPEPRLLPGDAIKRAQVRELVEIIASGIQPLQNVKVTQHLRQVGGEAAANDFAKDAIATGLRAFESHVNLHGGTYSVGDTLTLADVFLIPQLFNARRFDVDLTTVPRLLDIESRASEHAAFLMAHPDRQPDAPST